MDKMYQLVDLLSAHIFICANLFKNKIIINSAKTVLLEKLTTTNFVNTNLLLS